MTEMIWATTLYRGLDEESPGCDEEGCKELECSYYREGNRYNLQDCSDCFGTGWDQSTHEPCDECSGHGCWGYSW